MFLVTPPVRLLQGFGAGYLVVKHFQLLQLLQGRTEEKFTPVGLLILYVSISGSVMKPH